MIDKSPYGEPCNSCGLCCDAEPCPLGAWLFVQYHGRCPALMQEGELLVCGLIRAPEHYLPLLTMRHGAEAIADAAAILIGAGLGCDAQLEDESDNPAFRHRLNLWKSNPDNIAKTHDAAAKFGIPLKSIHPGVTT